MTGVIRKHRLLGGALVTTLALALAATGMLALWLHGMRIPLASGATWFQVTKTATADYAPTPNKPVFFLAVGNDGRGGESSTRGDALHLIGVNPAVHKATILDFPRDTAVAIPGHGVDKVNAAHTFGGSRLAAETIGATVGVDIPYVVDTDFPGFTSMVNEMGGLNVNVPVAMHDSYSGADFPAGPTHLDGDQALAFARNRHQFPTGDLQRTENQGLLLLAALAQLRAQSTGPVGTLHLLAILARHTHLDGIGLKDLYGLARLGLSVDPANVRNVVVPVASGRGSDLVLAPGARELFADFVDDAVLESH